MWPRPTMPGEYSAILGFSMPLLAGWELTALRPPFLYRDASSSAKVTKRDNIPVARRHVASWLLDSMQVYYRGA